MAANTTGEHVDKAKQIVAASRQSSSKALLALDACKAALSLLERMEYHTVSDDHKVAVMIQLRTAIRESANASVSISGDEPEYAPRACWVF